MHSEGIVCKTVHTDMSCFSPFGIPSIYSGLPPYITAFGEKRGFDDLRSHPRVCARSTHFGCLVPLSSQAKVSDLQCLPPNVIVLNFFKY